MTMRRKILMPIGAAICVVLLTASSCDKANEPFKDAPRAGLDGSPAMVVEMPDGFSNVATKCVGDVRITVAFHGDNKYGSVSTVLDPACRGNG